MKNDLNISNNVLLYGWSMRRVFEPGDLLYCEPIAFEDIRKGDIIVVDQKNGSHVYVHRVIKVSSDAIVTQGDNNCRPDRYPTTRKCNFVIVRSVSRKKNPKAPRELVPGGEEGMRIFHRNQLRRRIRSFFSLVIRALQKIAFWRYSLTEPVYFGKIPWFYYKNRPVAKIVGKRFVFLHWYDKLIFRIDFSSDKKQSEQDESEYDSEQC